MSNRRREELEDGWRREHGGSWPAPRAGATGRGPVTSREDVIRAEASAPGFSAQQQHRAHRSRLVRGRAERTANGSFRPTELILGGPGKTGNMWQEVPKLR